MACPLSTPGCKYDTCGSHRGGSCYGPAAPRHADMEDAGIVLDAPSYPGDTTHMDKIIAALILGVLGFALDALGVFAAWNLIGLHSIFSAPSATFTQVITVAFFISLIDRDRWTLDS